MDIIKKEEIIEILDWYDKNDYEIEDMTKDELLEFADSLREELTDWEGDGYSVHRNENIVSCMEALIKLAERS